MSLEKIDFSIPNFVSIDLGGTVKPFVHQLDNDGSDIWSLTMESGARLSVKKFDYPQASMSLEYWVSLSGESLFYDQEGRLCLWSIDLGKMLTSLIDENVEMCDHKPVLDAYGEFVAENRIAISLGLDLVKEEMVIGFNYLDSGETEIVTREKIDKEGCYVKTINYGDASLDVGFVISENVARVGVMTDGNELYAYPRMINSVIGLLEDRKDVTPGVFLKVLANL